MVREKAQVILEACLIFIAIVLFVFGILQIWIWLDVNVADRSNAFNEYRLQAGNDPDFYTDNGAILLDDYYTSRPLTEGVVFGSAGR